MSAAEPGIPAVPPKPSWRTRLPFFYGWVVVGSVFVAQTAAYGVWYSFAVYFVALLEEFGWGRAATAGVFSLHMMMMGLTGAASGRWIDRFGPSRVVPAGGIALAVGLVAASRLTELWEFYLYFGVVCGVGLGLSGWVPCVAVASRWFAARRGAAIGVASAGIGMGIVLMVPVNQYLISTFGWRSAYLILAAIAFLGITPQAALLQVGRPEDLGLRPDGAAAGEEPGRPREAARSRELVVVDPKWASRAWTTPMAMQTLRFWLLGGNIALCVLTNQMLWVHTVAYLVDAGYEKMLAAGVTSLAGFLSMPGKILWGAASDRFGREFTFTVGNVAMLAAIGLLVLAGAFPSPWLALLFAVVFSAGYSVNAAVGSAAAADVFAGRRFGAIYGAMNVGMGFGGAFGAWLAGYVFDATGSYLAAFGVAAAAGVASVACLWWAAPRKVRRIVARRT